MASVTIDVDLPPGVTITGYGRHGDDHGFEVAWPLPERCRCDGSGRQDKVRLEFRDTPQVVRDLDLWGQPSFWVYRPCYHCCPCCGRRQFVIPPLKRKDASYTYRVELHGLRQLISSNEEEVARRLAVSAETVARIVRNQLADAKDKEVDPARAVTDVGIDELRPKKPYQLYVTILTDLSDPDRPAVLAVAAGRDEAAARARLGKLSEAQRQEVRTYRADMAAAFHDACRELLPKDRAVVARFHVAEKLNKAINHERKKNGRAGGAGPGPQSRRVQHQGPRGGQRPRPPGQLRADTWPTC
jgi:transposase